jgi:carboxyl-terminal processing protease
MRTQRAGRFTAFLFTVLFALSLGLASGVLLDRYVLTAAAATPSEASDAGIDLRLLTEAWEKIDRVYVDRDAVDSKQLTYGAIAGMVESLGDTGHSIFMTPDMLEEQATITEGAFEGIGAEVQMKDGHVVIVTPMDDSPALKAGLLPGDVILKVDNESTDGQELGEVISRIKGPAGTKVVLTVANPDDSEIREINVTRGRIALRNVTWAAIPGTNLAQIRISSFSKNVTEDLKAVLQEVDRQGLTGIVLDLRNNPGGLLQEAIGVASQFLKAGTVVQERDAQGVIKTIDVRPGGLATDTPLVVLTNGGSASASEIVAGALQDAGRATVIGETTFGTGTVLQPYKLSDGSALLLAFEEWLTPKGRVIWHQGIEPDVEVKLPLGEVHVTPNAARTMTAEDIQSSGDGQLLAAIEELMPTP